MPTVTKTAKATGYLKNMGEVTATFAVYLFFGVNKGLKAAITLAPGETSIQLVLTPVSYTLDVGDTANASVIVDITAPSWAAQTNAYISPPVSFTNQGSVSASWSGSPSISRRVGIGDLGEFDLSIGDAEESPIPSWVAPAIGVAVVLTFLVGREKKLKIKKNPGAAWHRSQEDQGKREVVKARARGDQSGVNFSSGYAVAHDISAKMSDKFGIPNPGAAWHDTKRSIYERMASTLGDSIAGIYRQGMASGHEESAIAARRIGMFNPGAAWHQTEAEIVRKYEEQFGKSSYTRGYRNAHLQSELASKVQRIPNPGYAGFMFPGVEFYSRKRRDWVRGKVFTTESEAHREIRKLVRHGTPARLTMVYERNPRRK